MKKLILPLFCFFLLAWVSSTGAWMGAVGVGGGQEAAAGWSCPYIFCEEFEGSESGYDNAGWIENEGATGDVDPDDASPTTDCGWSGGNSDSLLINNPDGENNYVEIDLGSPDPTFGIRFRFYVDNLPEQYEEGILLYPDDSGAPNNPFYLKVQASVGSPPTTFAVSMYYRVAAGGYDTAVTLGTGLADNTWHTVSCKWSSGGGSGAGCLCQIEGESEGSNDETVYTAGVDIWEFGQLSWTNPWDINYKCVQISSSFEYPSGD